jgi:hypothetical protein
MQTFELNNGQSIKIGQYVRLDIYGRFLRIEDRLTNGLGTIMRAVLVDGRPALQRVVY